MTRSLVGYTGFVGGNLLARGEFAGLYNSKNIGEAFGSAPDMLYFCGISAQKFLANANPDADRAAIDTAIGNIERIRPGFIVLISTIDVYPSPAGLDEDDRPSPAGLDEDDRPSEEGLDAYGLNRLRLERWVESCFPCRLVVRLPGLYGSGLKKNFLFDMMTLIPQMLTAPRIASLDAGYLSRYYADGGDGIYRLSGGVSEAERAELRRYFAGCGFSSPYFTDSRALFQMYNLDCLYGHIERAVELGVSLLNVTAEPVTAAELHRYITGREFCNELPGRPPRYDLRSRWAESFGGRDGYFFDKQFVLDDVKRFFAAAGR